MQVLLLEKNSCILEIVERIKAKHITSSAQLYTVSGK
jgi:hypothetical protein